MEGGDFMQTAHTNFFYWRKVINNMTIKEVAGYTGIPQPTIVRYDNGTSPIEKASYERVVTFAKLFKCRPDDLMGYYET